MKRFCKCAVALYTGIVEDSFPIVVTGHGFKSCLQRAQALHIPYDMEATIYGYIMSDSSFVGIDNAAKYADELGIRHYEDWVEDFEIWPDLMPNDIYRG